MEYDYLSFFISTHAYDFLKFILVYNLCQWLSAWLQYIQCISNNGDTTVLLWAIDVFLYHETSGQNTNIPGKI